MYTTRVIYTPRISINTYNKHQKKKAEAQKKTMRTNKQKRWLINSECVDVCGREFDLTNLKNKGRTSVDRDTRPLSHLQYPVLYLSRIQRICHPKYFDLSFSIA